MLSRLRTGMLVSALVASLTVHSAHAHSAPSTCNFTVTTSGKNTVTELYVNHIKDGDTLSLMYTDAGRQKDRRAFRGYSLVGTNVSGATVVNQKAVTICSA